MTANLLDKNVHQKLVWFSLLIEIHYYPVIIGGGI